MNNEEKYLTCLPDGVKGNKAYEKITRKRFVILSNHKDRYDVYMNEQPTGNNKRF